MQNTHSSGSSEDNSFVTARYEQESFNLLDMTLDQTISDTRQRELRKGVFTLCLGDEILAAAYTTIKKNTQWVDELKDNTKLLESLQFNGSIIEMVSQYSQMPGLSILLTLGQRKDKSLYE